MQKKNNFFEKTLNWYLIVLIIFLPFQIFLAEVLEKIGHNTSKIFWLTHWYEFLLPIFFIAGVISAIIKKKKFSGIFWLSAGLILLGLLSIVLSPTVSKAIEGFRFALLPVLLFFIILLYDFSREEYTKILKILLIVSSIISAWAIFERFFPPMYWQSWGILNQADGFGYGPRLAGAYYQSSSFIGGPNQLASYLLPAFFLSLQRINFKKPQSTYLQLSTYLLTTILIALAIILSFSRSAIIGLLAGIIIYLVFMVKNKLIKYSGLAIIIFVVMTISYFYLYGSSEAREFLFHGTSNQFHTEALNNFNIEFSGRNIHDKLFGAGLGTSGPLVIKYGQGLIPESWYLQIILELGIIGFILWLIFMISLSFDLIKKNEPYLFLGLLAISTTAIFLHTWADNPALSFSLFILIGALTGEKNAKKNFN